MKKLLFVGILFTTVSFLVNCGSSRKATAEIPKMTYQDNIQTILTEKCSPCHFPAKGGNKRPFDNYENVKTDIDEILRRVQLNPGERGYMPFKKPKLSDSTIAVIKSWKEDGLLLSNSK